MHLVPFTEEDYSLLIDWIPDEEFCMLWAGPVYTWPLTLEQIRCHQKKQEITAFIPVENNQKIGFIEIVKISDREVRLSRVLISRASDRGKGYGKTLVELAVDHARTRFNAKRVSLAVFEHNGQAIRCYTSLGFKIISREEKSRRFNGEWWPLLRMEKRV